MTSELGFAGWSLLSRQRRQWLRREGWNSTARLEKDESSRIPGEEGQEEECRWTGGQEPDSRGHTADLQGHPALLPVQLLAALSQASSPTPVQLSPKPSGSAAPPQPSAGSALTSLLPVHSCLFQKPLFVTHAEGKHSFSATQSLPL